MQKVSKFTDLLYFQPLTFHDEKNTSTRFLFCTAVDL